MNALVQRSVHEFLPAALEVQETPPSPVGRTVIWLIVSFFVIALTWSYFGEIDIVAVAHGKIIPTGRVKVIQPAELGVVRSIHVHEGQWVNEGDLLIDLDRTTSSADHERVRAELESGALDRARLVALLDALDEKRYAVRQLHADEHIDPGALQTQQRMLESQYLEYRSRQDRTESELRSARAERASIAESVTKLTATLPIVTKRAQALKQLSAKKMASELQYLELEQARIEQAGDLAAERRRLEQVDANIQAILDQQAVQRSEFRSQLLQELATVGRNIRSLEQELVKADQRRFLQKIRAPISGQVQQLAIHTIGGVVQPAQELLRIVPADDELQVEAFLQNKDIGFVEVGQTAEVKIEAFPFTKYGVIDGEIVDISDDAIQSEDVGLIYAARVSIARTLMEVGDREVKLSPGMAVSVEVKTGKRRVIEFLLSPIMRGIAEAAKER